MLMPWISTVFGVDFSGAAQSGKTAWLAEMHVLPGEQRLRLADLKPLGRLAGEDGRDAVCEYLVRRIRRSDQAFWGMDFPFGLPVELNLGGWPGQLAHNRSFSGDAKDYGRYLVGVSQKNSDVMHIRRTTDRETKTPFDCYHYRIIYQTFHGMGQVLAPIADDSETAVLPFTYARLSQARRVVVEACPASTLKRLGLPHQRYKQSAGKPVEGVHRKTRRRILKGIHGFVDISAYRRKIVMTDPGGDALDAVLAGMGSWHAMQNVDHESVSAHPRYSNEGYVYC